MSAVTKVLLASATGLVGKEALGLLLAGPRVTQIVTPTRRAIARQPKFLNTVADIATLLLDAPWWAVDGAISALGTTRARAGSPNAYRAINHDYAITIARGAREGGAGRFAIVTAMGANARSWFRYTRLKGELEDAVARLAIPSLTILCPGFRGGARPRADAMEQLVGRFIMLIEPILPASMRINPAKTVPTLLVEVAIGRGPGQLVISAADIVAAEKGKSH